MIHRGALAVRIASIVRFREAWAGDSHATWNEVREEMRHVTLDHPRHLNRGSRNVSRRVGRLSSARISQQVGSHARACTVS
jgi:hypothetical protein